jgi:hypothetical protein
VVVVVGITCWPVVVRLAGAIVADAAFCAGGCGRGVLAGFGFGLGLGLGGVGAAAVAVVVVGVAAAVLVVREVELDEAAPHPATASATRHENTIAGLRGCVIICSSLRSLRCFDTKDACESDCFPRPSRRRLCSRRALQ